MKNQYQKNKYQVMYTRTLTRRMQSSYGIIVDDSIWPYSNVCVRFDVGLQVATERRLPRAQIIPEKLKNIDVLYSPYIHTKHIKKTFGFCIWPRLSYNTLTPFLLKHCQHNNTYHFYISFTFACHDVFFIRQCCDFLPHTCQLREGGALPERKH